jgi:dienelactone hydrolase
MTTHQTGNCHPADDALSRADSPQIEELQLTIDDRIVGTLARPRDARNFPAVLLLHGFASHRDEVGDLFKRLASMLASHGIVSLRIDFPGSGDSPGLFVSNISARVDAAASAYRYLAGIPEVDMSRIGVLGFSMGGVTARISAAAHPEWYRSMAAWSSASTARHSYARASKRLRGMASPSTWAFAGSPLARTFSRIMLCMTANTWS